MFKEIIFSIIFLIFYTIVGTMTAPSTQSKFANDEVTITNISLFDRRDGDFLIHSERVFSNTTERKQYRFVPYIWNSAGEEVFTSVLLHLPGDWRYMETRYKTNQSRNWGRHLEIGVFTKPTREYYFDVEIYGLKDKGFGVESKSRSVQRSVDGEMERASYINQ